MRQLALNATGEAADPGDKPPMVDAEIDLIGDAEGWLEDTAALAHTICRQAEGTSRLMRIPAERAGWFVTVLRERMVQLELELMSIGQCKLESLDASALDRISEAIDRYSPFVERAAMRMRLVEIEPVEPATNNAPSEDEPRRKRAVTLSEQVRKFLAERHEDVGTRALAKRIGCSPALVNKIKQQHSGSGDSEAAQAMQRLVTEAMEPTSALPGTRDKLKIMRARAARGLPVCRKDDGPGDARL